MLDTFQYRPFWDSVYIKEQLIIRLVLLVNSIKKPQKPKTYQKVPIKLYHILYPSFRAASSGVRVRPSRPKSGIPRN